MGRGRKNHVAIRFCDILQRVVFHGEGRKHISAIASTVQEHDPSSEPRKLFQPLVEGCDPVYFLPDDESFVESLESLIDEQKPDDIFVLPPFRSRNKVTSEFRQKYPGMGLEEAALKTLANKLSPGCRIAAILPNSFFFGESTRSFREAFLSANSLKYALTPDFNPGLLGLPFHTMFRLGCLVIHVGQDDPSLRIFRIPDSELENTPTIGDLENLVRRRNGHSQYGYVLREGLAPGMPIAYDLYSPEFRLKQEKLGQLGGTASLLELVDIVRGLHMTLEASRLVEAESGLGVPIVDGRSIGADGQILIETVRFRVADPPDRHFLRIGDICIPCIQSPRPSLKCAVIREQDLPAATSHSVLVLRPKANVSDEQLQILYAYLRSPQAAEDIAAQNSYVHITVSGLSNLKVPVPDESLVIAIRTLDHSIRQFRSWVDEATRAKDSLFTFSSISDSRSQILSLGRMTRRRTDAANLVDDLRHRVRTLFPHPVAYRWRTVESSLPDLEGYQNVLECAENLTSYIAALVVIHSRLVDGGNLPAIGQLGEKLGQNPGHGISMGDWVNIIRQAASSKVLRAASPTTPFFEAADFLRNNKDANEAIQRLSKRRNDHAHGRGPKGQTVHKAYGEAMATLQQLLGSVEFLADYPLHFVETTRRDSMRKLTRYGFRRMMGDHSLVPLEEAEGNYAEMEAQSLYVVDRNSVPHLARPFLVMRTCPVCHTRSTFMLEKFDVRTNTCTLKSLEHGHNVDDTEVAEAYRYVGLL